MKINEAISRIDDLKPNTYSQSDKIKWLSHADATVKRLIIDTHEGADKEEEINKYIQNNVIEYEKSIEEYMKVNEVSYEEAKEEIPFTEIKYKDAKEHIENTRRDIMFSGYDDSTDLNTELLVPEPFDEMYLRWLESQIDYYNGEYGKYNNAIVMYNAAYEAYRNEYNRTHMPLGKTIKYF